MLALAWHRRAVRASLNRRAVRRALFIMALMRPMNTASPAAKPITREIIHRQSAASSSRDSRYSRRRKPRIGILGNVEAKCEREIEARRLLRGIAYVASALAIENRELIRRHVPIHRQL